MLKFTATMMTNITMDRTTYSPNRYVAHDFAELSQMAFRKAIKCCSRCWGRQRERREGGGRGRRARW
jgi:hypothetical protein